MILGSVESLRDPDAVIIDLAGYHFFFPNQPLASARDIRQSGLARTESDAGNDRFDQDLQSPRRRLVNFSEGSMR